MQRTSPDRRVFAHALERLGAAPDQAVMVGDNIARDVEGALAAGLRAVWLNRDGRTGACPPGAIEVAALTELTNADVRLQLMARR